MTLIAGFKCLDGFVIAADTEITLDPLRIQGQKIKKYDNLVCAGSGDDSYIDMACQHIRDAINGLPQKTLPEIKKAVDQTITRIYKQYIFKNWGKEERPSFDLIIGIKDQDGTLALLRTEKNAVFEVETFTFAGYGSFLGSYLAEKLYRGPVMSFSNTAWMVHLVLQIFREVKDKGLYVRWKYRFVVPRKPQAPKVFLRSKWGILGIFGE